MPDDNKLIIDIPRRIVHRKSEDKRYTDNGAAFAWIDLSSAVNLEVECEVFKIYFSVSVPVYVTPSTVRVTVLVFLVVG